MKRNIIYMFSVMLSMGLLTGCGTPSASKLVDDMREAEISSAKMNIESKVDMESEGYDDISKYIKLKENIKPLSKVLLIDDIYTTGNTIRTMVSMLKSIGIKQIKGLVLCKTQLEGNEDENLMQ